jgi:hypothetical protein
MPIHIYKIMWAFQTPNCGSSHHGIMVDPKPYHWVVFQLVVLDKI